MPQLKDAFGRVFEYLRLSVDDACNMRCVYCLPGGFKRQAHEPPLTRDEARRLGAAFAGLGVWKFRVTGGEPMVRGDLVELCADLAAVPGCRKLALSTNGWRLAQLARPLKRAGVSAVNVSVDTLERSSFARVTGRDALPRVLRGVERALEEGMEVKINAVLLASIPRAEREAMLAWTRSVPVCVRFIELMPTTQNLELFSRERLSAGSLVESLLADGWRERPRAPGDGPARRFEKDGHAGGVGVIAPYARDFCSTCNRLRVTSRGGLRLCLFAEGELALRPWLARDEQKEELQRRLQALLGRKDASHYLPEGRYGGLATFSALGG